MYDAISEVSHALRSLSPSPTVFTCTNVHDRSDGGKEGQTITEVSSYDESEQE